MRNDATSFISERTAELTIIPRLLADLHPYYPKITPLFYWATREGATISKGSFQWCDIRLLVVYARRPKVSFPDDPQVHIKLNQMLFTRANYFTQQGIPVIAGFPIANKLEDIHFATECAWVKIDPHSIEIEFDISVEDKHIENSRLPLLGPEQIAGLIDESPRLQWRSIIEKLDEFRRTSPYFSQFSFGGGDPYRPIYILAHAG